MTGLRRPCGCFADPLVFGHCWQEHELAELEQRLRAAPPQDWLEIIRSAPGRVSDELALGRGMWQAEWAPPLVTPRRIWPGRLTRRR